MGVEVGRAVGFEDGIEVGKDVGSKVGSVVGSDVGLASGPRAPTPGTCTSGYTGARTIGASSDGCLLSGSSMNSL